MKQQPLDSSLISDPRAYSLTMRIAPGRLDIMALDDTADTVIYRRLALDRTMTATRAIEEAVYDNPALLGDFRAITALIDTRAYTLVPPEVAADSVLAAAVAERLLPAPDCRSELLTTPLRHAPATILWRISCDMAAFLRRTFFNVSILPAVAPLADSLTAPSDMSSGRIYVNLRQGALDIVALGTGGALDCVNTFDYSEPADAVYYIMALYRSLTPDGGERELILSGDPEARETVTPMLRRFVPFVMPAIMPAALFRAGRDLLKAPYDLIVNSFPPAT